MYSSWFQASYGSGRWEDAPYIPFQVIVTVLLQDSGGTVPQGWWGSPFTIPLATASSSILEGWTASFRGGPLWSWPQGSPHARRPKVLSLPLVTVRWAQLIDDRDSLSATWLPRTNSVLLPFFQAVEENNPAAQRLLLLPVKLCRQLCVAYSSCSVVHINVYWLSSCCSTNKYFSWTHNPLSQENYYFSSLHF